MQVVVVTVVACTLYFFLHFLEMNLLWEMVEIFLIYKEMFYNNNNLNIYL